MRKLFVIALLATLAGCASVKSFPMSIAVRPSHNARITGEALMVSQIEAIKNALGCLTPEMLSDPELIFHITWDTNHLGVTWRGNVPRGHAHAYDEEMPKICLKYNEVELEVIWHEVAHIHQARLDRKRRGFTREWSAIAGEVYTKKVNEPDGQGILDAYSRVDCYEDVAVWVSFCYEYIHRYAFKTRDRISRLVDRKTDTRYRKKLALLHQYHFFSDEDYKKLKPLFE